MAKKPLTFFSVERHTKLSKKMEYVLYFNIVNSLKNIALDDLRYLIRLTPVFYQNFVFNKTD